MPVCQRRKTIVFRKSQNGLNNEAGESRNIEDSEIGNPKKQTFESNVNESEEFKFPQDNSNNEKLMSHVGSFSKAVEVIDEVNSPVPQIGQGI
mmetsp:Transcript_11307/g.19034  ORF Transcript_11307/g.19034 Transcript_11307/m.19034 type:complete len:93 (-) Transcript_11307:31-309(-)